MVGVLVTVALVCAIAAPSPLAARMMPSDKTITVVGQHTEVIAADRVSIRAEFLTEGRYCMQLAGKAERHLNALRQRLEKIGAGNIRVETGTTRQWRYEPIRGMRSTSDGVLSWLTVDLHDMGAYLAVRETILTAENLTQFSVTPHVMEDTVRTQKFIANALLDAREQAAAAITDGAASLAEPVAIHINPSRQELFLEGLVSPSNIGKDGDTKLPDLGFTALPVIRLSTAVLVRYALR